ncbi:MAG: pirin family protein [Lysobacterales bacterium]
MDYYRPSQERGEANHGWLRSRHSFSFGDYYDPAHMGFGVLRVINDDWVGPGKGFAEHSHKDMEIISYVREGTIAHRDTMGHVSQLTAGQVQRMSAGTGVSHSEFNASNSDPLRFLQIWVLPQKPGIKPSYEDQTPVIDGSVTALISPEGRGNTLSINQDMVLNIVVLEPGQRLSMPAGDRAAYLHGVEGTTMLNAQSIGPGDGVGLTQVQHNTQLVAKEQGFTGLWFDLPAIAPG